MSAVSTSSRSTHSSRGDRSTVSSTATTSSGRDRASSRSTTHPAVESAVTRLLVAIKQLLEALTQWSTLRMNELQVSDVYVRLGNDFNAAVQAFAAFNIDMSELMSVPDDLRSVLEQCLAEDATPENLEIYLPGVRKVITTLLQGLRGKQSEYRAIMSEQRHRSVDTVNQDRVDSRGSRSSRSHRSQLSRSIAENDRPTAEAGPSRRTTASSTTSARRKESVGSSSPSTVPPPVREEHFVGGFRTPNRDLPPSINGTPNDTQHAQSPAYFPDVKERIAGDDTPRATPSTSTPPNSGPLSQGGIPQSPHAPPDMKRYSLSDRPMPPAVVVDSPEGDSGPGFTPASPPPDTPPIENATLQSPAIANSLAALKKSDALERRASKRFSTYNISKMTGGSVSRERSANKSSNRRSLLAGGSAPTAGDLAVLTEVDDEEPEQPSPVKITPVPEEPESSAIPPVPPLPRTPSPSHSRPVSRISRERSAQSTPVPTEVATGAPFTVFLQVGREVKKAKLEQNVSFASLRMIFVDKFSYNPGLENFPAIYIRDPSSGVQYELEDVEEVKPKCLLSLNIEPLDQIKQHIDAQISSLSGDLKELRSAMVATQHPSVQEVLTDAPQVVNRPTDRQLHHVARRLTRLMHNDDRPPPSPLQQQMTGQSLQPQMTGGSEYSGRIVSDLKTQFDEVQNLRRDIGIMRQLYTDFMKQTKESLGTLRTQTQSVKKLASDNVGGARGYIDTGKTKLDGRSQNVLTKVEELQDTVERVREDVLKRHVSPKPFVLQNIKRDITVAATELESLKEHITTIKPMWKKTWEEELQNIVEEQQFLHHQEEFLSDLLEDHKAVLEVWGHVEKVISLRGAGSGRGKNGLRAFKPPPTEEGHEGLTTVMLELRGAQVDPEKRMKAIAANQKNRAKELAAKSDEFTEELAGFVGGKKLKMTGGAEEAERVRQRRNEMTLKAMFNGGGTGPSSNDDTDMSPSSVGSNSF